MGASREGNDAAGVARAYFEAAARRDPEAMAALWEPGATAVVYGIREMKVPEGLREWYGGLFASFPDFTYEVLDLMTADGKAAVHWRGSGTFDGTAPFEGLNPNGSKVELKGCDVLAVRDGRIVGGDTYLNGTEFGRQLGILPAAGSLQEKAITDAINLKARLGGLVRGRRF